MNNKERRTLIGNCLREYYTENKQILIDESVTKITCISYLLYNLIFFGNKILIFKETLEQLIKISKEEVFCKKDEISVKNATYILESIKRDEWANYKILEGQYKKTKKQSIIRFLKQNPNTIFYLEDNKLYQDLNENGLNNQLYLLIKGMVEVNPFESKSFKFETIGAIVFENGKMLIHERGNALIKVYNQKGVERKESPKEVKSRDIVLIRGDKEDIYSFNLYEIVSKHTRNHAIRIIWTEIKKGQKSNKYIDRLPYQYRKIILDNM